MGIEVVVNGNGGACSGNTGCLSLSVAIRESRMRRRKQESLSRRLSYKETPSR